jgi:outer membrane protein assembly factor BamB
LRGNVLVAMWLVFVLVGQAVVWNVPFARGRAVPVMISYSMGIVTVFVLLAWLALCSPLRRRTALLATAALLVPIVGFAASIRTVHFTGDMEPILTFRWEATLEDRLREFQARATAGVGRISNPSTPTPGEVPIPTPEDMPEYRGVNRDGVVIGPPLATDWARTPPRELWRRPCGEGYASFSVVGDFVVTLEQRGVNEAIVCYDAATGSERWVRDYPARFFQGMDGPGPRATPTISGQDVFSLGAQGDLYCLDLLTGEPRWSTNILTGNGLVLDGAPFNAIWGMAGSPLIVDDMLIVNAGGPVGNGLVAYDRATGDVLWRGEGLAPTATSAPSPTSASRDADPRDTNPTRERGNGLEAAPEDAASREVDPRGTAPDDAPPTPLARPSSPPLSPPIPGIGANSLNRAGYSSPHLATLAGERQVLIFDGVGLRGCDVATGRQLWFYKFDHGDSPGRINVAQPLLVPGDRVFISASYGRGAAMLHVTPPRDDDGWSVTQTWDEDHLRNMRCTFTTPVLHEGHIYGLDEGLLTCLDVETGNRLWKKSRDAQFGHGQLLLTNGLLVVLSEPGEIVLIDPSPERLTILGRVAALSGAKTWNPPALVRGRIYVRNHVEAACFDLRGE